MHGFVKYLITLAAALTAGALVRAQDKPEPPFRYEMGVSVAGYPAVALDYFDRGAFYILGRFEDVSPIAHSDDYLKYIYGDHNGPIYGTGTVQF